MNHDGYIWQTELIRLRPVQADDWEVHHEWDMNSDMVRNIGTLHFPQTAAQVQAWIERLSSDTDDSDNQHLQIESRETSELLGIIASHHTDRRNGVFYYAVAIRQEYQRQGYATEAILLLLRFFFQELRYQKCNAQVYGWNAASRKLQESLGFLHEGTIRRKVFAMGKFWDEYNYGITVEEWRDRYNPR